MKALAVSTGDPGGVGPEVALRAALEAPPDAPPTLLYGDPEWLQKRAREVAADVSLKVLDSAEQAAALEPGQVAVCAAGPAWDGEALRHEPTPRGGAAQLAALDAAVAAVRAGHARALCTAPMSKHAVNLAGAPFVGHTEHLARGAGLADDDVTMMFLGPRLRVALVTTHLAVAELPRAITRARVLRTVRHLAQAMLRAPTQADPAERVRFRRRPCLAVAGLNPHASEDGLFGSEEASVIAPAIETLQAEPPFSDGTVELRGPVPAETAFRQAASGEIEAVAAMAHDQATIASKLLDWGEAVNVTWGLPFVRTSVDHGVAYDAAMSGEVDARGMQAALRMCQRLSEPES